MYRCAEKRQMNQCAATAPIFTHDSSAMMPSCRQPLVSQFTILSAEVNLTRASAQPKPSTLANPRPTAPTAGLLRACNTSTYPTSLRRMCSQSLHLAKGIPTQRKARLYRPCTLMPHPPVLTTWCPRFCPSTGLPWSCLRLHGWAAFLHVTYRLQ